MYIIPEDSKSGLKCIGENYAVLNITQSLNQILKPLAVIGARSYPNIYILPELPRILFL